MNSNDNQKPGDEAEDAWESIGEIVARLLRDIAPERDAA